MIMQQLEMLTPNTSKDLQKNYLSPNIWRKIYTKHLPPNTEDRYAVKYPNA